MANQRHFATSFFEHLCALLIIATENRVDFIKNHFTWCCLLVIKIKQKTDACGSLDKRCREY